LKKPPGEAWSEKDKEHALQYDELAIVQKLNTVRLSLATAIAFLMHTRLLYAAKDTLGHLEDDVMSQVMYFYVRLQCLLYPSEMEIVDEALLVTWHPDSHKMEGNHYRAECCRHLPETAVLGETVIGRPNTTGRTVTPLPFVTLNLLLASLRQGIDKPWGLPERMLNCVAEMMQTARESMADLQTVVAQPLPLAYIQHCHGLLVMFALAYPLSINPDDGFINNVLMPTVIFAAMTGIEIISGLLENPLGDDETDLNLMDHVHALEASCQLDFEMSERYQHTMQEAAWKPLQDFHMSASSQTSAPEGPVGTPELRCFDTYFTWTAMPVKMLEWSLLNHGRAREVHEARWMHGEWRELRRKISLALSKITATHAAPSPDANSYHMVGQHDSEDDELLEQTWKNHIHSTFGRDPSCFCHHLVFNGSTMSKKQHEERRNAESSSASDVRKSKRNDLLRGLSKTCMLEPDEMVRTSTGVDLEDGELNDLSGK